MTLITAHTKKTHVKQKKKKKVLKISPDCNMFSQSDFFMFSAPRGMKPKRITKAHLALLSFNITTSTAELFYCEFVYVKLSNVDRVASC